MIIGLNLGILGTILLGSLLWPPSYEAESTIIVRGRNYETPLFQGPQREGPWTVLMNAKDEINSEIEVIRSRPVLERTVVGLQLYKSGLYEDSGFFGALRTQLARAWSSLTSPLEGLGLWSQPSGREAVEKAVKALERRLEVEPAIESQIIRVRYRARDPGLASRVVNRVVSEYLQQHLAINLNPTESSFYSDQIKTLEVELQEVQSQLVALKTQTGIVSFEEQTKSLLDKLNTFDVARTTIQKELISRRSKVEKVRNLREKNPSLLIPLPEIKEDIQIQDLENKLINLRYELETVSDRYTDGSRQMVTIRRQVDELEQQIRNHVTVLLERDIAELSKLEAEEQALSQTIDILKGELQSLPAKEMAIINLTQKVKAKEEVLSVMRRKYQESLVAQASDHRVQNAKVVSEASPPLKPVVPNLPLNIILGIFLAALTSMSLAFLAEYHDDSVRMPEDVEQVLGLEVLASVPEL
jgi:uncharacterized protein involved in exopolysaccharide biosynthesis